MNQPTMLTLLTNDPALKQKIVLGALILGVFIFWFFVIWLKNTNRERARPQTGGVVEADYALKALPQSGKEFMAAVQASTKVARTLKNCLIFLVTVVAAVIFCSMTLFDMFAHPSDIMDGGVLWTAIPAIVSIYIAKGSGRDCLAGLRRRRDRKPAGDIHSNGDGASE